MEVERFEVRDELRRELDARWEAMAQGCVCLRRSLRESYCYVEQGGLTIGKEQDSESAHRLKPSGYDVCDNANAPVDRSAEKW